MVNVADLMTLCREEREAHPTADHQAVDHVEQGVDHAELVGHLRATEDRHERPAGIVADAEQDLDLLLEQPAGRRR